MNSIELPNSLQTDQLLLRGPLPDDTAEFHTTLVESLPPLRPWFAWAKNTPTPETSAAFVAESHRGFQERHQVDWFVFLKKTQTFIGIVSLHSAGFMTVDWSHSTQLLSYWLLTDYTGQGYMTEAVDAVVKFAFSLPNIRRLQIHCNVKNTRSAALAKRLGFVYHETVPDDATFDDVYVKERSRHSVPCCEERRGACQS